MKKSITRQLSSDSLASRKALKFTATFAAISVLMAAGITPANAEEKPSTPKIPVVVGNVDVNGPHVNSDASISTKDLGPCSYLLSAITPLGFSWGQVAAYPKMKFQSLSGLIVPLYWY
jgi:hypothetical protein